MSIRKETIDKSYNTVYTVDWPQSDPGVLRREETRELRYYRYLLPLEYPQWSYRTLCYQLVAARKTSYDTVYSFNLDWLRSNNKQLERDT